MTARNLVGILSSVTLLGLVAASAASCKVDTYSDDGCYGASSGTTCGTVCEDYCDGWGCRPYCYDTCWSGCGSSGSTTGGTTGPTKPDAGADASKPDASRPDGSTGGSTSLLCTSCSTHGDCGTGNKCLALGGGASTGFCGVSCAKGACPADYECLGVEDTKQCVPIARKCEVKPPPPVAECSAQRACVPGSTCVEGKCALDCTSVAACATGEICLDRKYCAPYASLPCADDTGCETAERCVGATTGPSATKGTCSPICLAAQDCPKGWACGADGVCAAAPPAGDAGAP